MIPHTSVQPARRSLQRTRSAPARLLRPARPTLQSPTPYGGQHLNVSIGHPDTIQPPRSVMAGNDLLNLLNDTEHFTLSITAMAGNMPSCGSDALQLLHKDVTALSACIRQLSEQLMYLSNNPSLSFRISEVMRKAAKAMARVSSS